MNTLLGLLAVFLLTLGTGYFVVQEFAYVAADRTLLREQAANGDAEVESNTPLTIGVYSTPKILAALT